VHCVFARVRMAIVWRARCRAITSSHPVQISLSLAVVVVPNVSLKRLMVAATEAA